MSLKTIYFHSYGNCTHLTRVPVSKGLAPHSVPHCYEGTGSVHSATITKRTKHGPQLVLIPQSRPGHSHGPGAGLS